MDVPERYKGAWLSTLRGRLRERFDQLVPPLQVEDVLGLEALAQAYDVADDFLQRGVTVRLSEWRRCHAFGINMVCRADPELAGQAGLEPEGTMPPEVAIHERLRRYEAWGNRVLLPALVRAGERGWTYDSSTREGVLAREWLSAEHRLKYDLSAVPRALERAFRSIGDRQTGERLRQSPEEVGGWLRVLEQLGPPSVMRAKTGELQPDVGSVRDRLAKMQRRPRAERDQRTPEEFLDVHHVDQKSLAPESVAAVAELRDRRDEFEALGLREVLEAIEGARECDVGSMADEVMRLRETLGAVRSPALRAEIVHQWSERKISRPALAERLGVTEREMRTQARAAAVKVAALRRQSA